MQVRIVVVTPFQQNCSVFWCEETMKGAVVDPGGDLDVIQSAIDESGATIDKVILTHGHVDHAAFAGDLAKKLGVPIIGPHIGDKFLIDKVAEQAASYGFGSPGPFQPDQWLDQGDVVEVGKDAHRTRPGDRVTVLPSAAGACGVCAGGGVAVLLAVGTRYPTAPTAAARCVRRRRRTRTSHSASFW